MAVQRNLEINNELTMNRVHLGPGALAHGDDAVLVRVEHLPHLPWHDTPPSSSIPALAPTPCPRAAHASHIRATQRVCRALLMGCHSPCTWAAGRWCWWGSGPASPAARTGPASRCAAPPCWAGTRAPGAAPAVTQADGLQRGGRQWHHVNIRQQQPMQRHAIGALQTSLKVQHWQSMNALTLPCKITASCRLPHLELLAGGVVPDECLQAAPVGARRVGGDALAPLQVELVHLLGYVVRERRRPVAHLPLERRLLRPCARIAREESVRCLPSPVLPTTYDQSTLLRTCCAAVGTAAAKGRIQCPKRIADTGVWAHRRRASPPGRRHC